MKDVDDMRNCVLGCQVAAKRGVHKIISFFIDGLALLEAFPFTASSLLHSLFFWLVNPLDFLPESKEPESNRFPCVGQAPS